MVGKGNGGLTEYGGVEHESNGSHQANYGVLLVCGTVDGSQGDSVLRGDDDVECQDIVEHKVDSNIDIGNQDKDMA